MSRTSRIPTMVALIACWGGMSIAAPSDRQVVLVDPLDEGLLEALIASNESLARKSGGLSYDFKISQVNWVSEVGPWSDTAVGSELISPDGSRRLDVERTEPYHVLGSPKVGFRRAKLRAVSNDQYSACLLSPSTNPCQVYEHLAMTASSDAELAMVFETSFSVPVHRLAESVDFGKSLREAIHGPMNVQTRIVVERLNGGLIRVERRIVGNDLPLRQWDFDSAKSNTLCAARAFYGVAGLPASTIAEARLNDLTGRGDWFPSKIHSEKSVLRKIRGRQQLERRWSRSTVISNSRVGVPFEDDDASIIALRLPDGYHISWETTGGQNHQYYALNGQPIPLADGKAKNFGEVSTKLLLRLDREQAASEVKPPLLADAQISEEFSTFATVAATPKKGGGTSNSNDPTRVSDDDVLTTANRASIGRLPVSLKGFLLVCAGLTSALTALYIFNRTRRKSHA